MAEPAPEAERGEQQILLGALRPMPGRQRERRQDQHSAERRVGLRHLRRIEPGEIARGEVVERVAEGGDQREQHGPMHRADARMHHQQHADEAGGDGEHAMPTDPFIEQGPGQCRDQQRRQEEDGDGLVELEIAQRQEIESRGHHHQHGAQDLQHGPLRAERRLEGERPERDRAEHHMADKAEPRHLGDRDALLDDQIFARRIQHGEAERGERHQPDRLQPVVGIAIGGGNRARRHGGVFLHQSLPKHHRRLRSRAGRAERHA